MNFKRRNPKIFVFSGKPNAGKDTACEFIYNYVKSKGYKVLNIQIGYYIKMYAKSIIEWDGTEDTKPRSLLQELGTDIIRNKIDPDFFVKRIIEDIRIYSYYFDVITVSDARLPGEIDGIYNAFNNVYKVNIQRPNYDNGLTDEQNSHFVENALNEYDKYDFVILNDSTLENLNIKVKSIVNEVFSNEEIN